MSYPMDYDNPAWLAQHCDPHEPFERACGKALRKLNDQNNAMLKALQYIHGLALADECRDMPSIVAIAAAALAEVDGSPP